MALVTRCRSSKEANPPVLRLESSAGRPSLCSVVTQAVRGKRGIVATLAEEYRRKAVQESSTSMAMWSKKKKDK